MSYLIHRWNLWKLQQKRRGVQKSFAAKFELLKQNKDAGPYDAAELQADEYYENQNMDEWIDAFRSSYLIDQAIECDVEPPPVSDDSEFWQFTDDHESWYLNRKGRDLLQKLISEKKDRNSEDWARFGRIFVPIITAVSGLIGVIIGLIAVLHHRS